MNEMDRLKAAFESALGLDGTVADWSSVAYGSIEQWDSVAHMNLAAAIESEFQVTLDADEVLGLMSFDDAVNILKMRGALSASR